MQNGTRELPALDLLRGFEAAARNLSFTRAGLELHLTQSAVSRQVKALEEQLGVALFHRRHRELLLTEAGQTLYKAVSDALRTTGVTDLLASGLTVAARAMPAYAAVLLIMVAAMLVTPFLNNAATVLVLAPIAAGLAQNLGLRPDAFLIAVAVGAGSDFLTPIGHQCNTLVMGPGGYNFGDYWRLGLPLSIIVALAGTALIMLVWPLH